MNELIADPSAELDHTKYERMIAHAKEAPSATIIVVHPCDESSPQRGAIQAAADGLIVPIFVGPERRIRTGASQFGFDLSKIEIVDAPHSDAAAERGVSLIREGKGEMLMKGSLHTDELMTAVTNSATGLARNGG